MQTRSSITLLLNLSIILCFNITFSPSVSHSQALGLLLDAKDRSCCGVDFETLLVSPVMLKQMTEGEWCVPSAYNEADVLAGIQHGTLAVPSVHPPTDACET